MLTATPGPGAIMCLNLFDENCYRPGAQRAKNKSVGIVYTMLSDGGSTDAEKEKQLSECFFAAPRGGCE